MWEIKKKESEDKPEQKGGASLREEIPILLRDYVDQVKEYGWKLEVVELEKGVESGSFREGEFYQGQLMIRFCKLEDGKNIELARLQSINSSINKQLDTNDTNDIFTDRYFYQFDQRKFINKTSDVIRTIRYQEAGGDPNQSVWLITPEQLIKYYPELSESKILVEGWSKNFDGLLAVEKERAKEIIAIFGSIFAKYIKSENSKLVAVTAGNSAGVQRLAATAIEEAGCSRQLLFALPESKDAKKYIIPSPNKTLVLQAPPREGRAGQWGDELVGPTGIASAEFKVRVVLLVGGGDNLRNQLSIYLDNVLVAQEKKKMYVIAAIQGVGGESSKEILFADLQLLAQEEKYKPLFPFGLLNERFLPNWLVLIDSKEEDDNKRKRELANQIDALIMRAHYSDWF